MKTRKSKLRDERVDGNDYPSIRERLETIGERMIHLSQRISEDGEQMTDEERNMVKMANATYIKYEFEECMLQYMVNGYADTLFLDQLFHNEK